LYHFYVATDNLDICVELHTTSREIRVFDNTFIDIWLQDILCAITAFIIINVEFFDTNQTMIFNPFLEIYSFVFRNSNYG